MNDWKNEMPEMSDNVIVLQDESGNDVEFAFLCQLEYNDAQYAVLMPLEDFDGEVVILRVEEGENEDEEQFLAVEDDETLNAVFNIFKEMFQEQLDFADDE